MSATASIGLALGALTAVERADLNAHEATIEHGLKRFIEVGQALVRIRDRRLYRATHAAFEDYCEQRWQISRPYASRLVDAATVTELISVPIGTEINSGPADKPEPPPAPAVVPANEAQVRPLAKLLPEPTAPPARQAEARQEIRETWDEAVATAPRDDAGQPRVTAKHVEETVANRLERERQPDSTPRPAGQLDEYLATSPTVIAAAWRKNFMGAIVRCSSITAFTPEQAAEKADAELVAEVVRLAADLTDYANRVESAWRKANGGLRLVSGGAR